MTEEPKSRIDTAIEAVANTVTSALKSEHYAVEQQECVGPIFYIVIGGSEPDVMEVERVRGLVEGAIPGAMSQHLAFDDFGFQLSVGLKGENFFVSVEIVFP